MKSGNKVALCRAHKEEGRWGSAGGVEGRVQALRDLVGKNEGKMMCGEI